MTGNKHKPYRGFTLVELLIAVATLYIVLGVVTPSAKRIIDKHRISADINRTNALVRYARTLAINQIETIKLCPSNDYSQCNEDWKLPLIVFIDLNHNNIRDKEEPLMAAGSAIARQHYMTGPKSPIKFYENGTNASPASLTLCPINKDNTLARAIYISLQGRTRLSVDYNNDGIHERIKNKNIVC